MKTRVDIKMIINKLLQDQTLIPQQAFGQAFAPSNIALCKYWGKRDEQLNLPLTNSLSVSLGNYGATTKISEIDAIQDNIWLNGIDVTHQQNDFSTRLIAFLDLFRRTPNTRFLVETEVNIPIAAGLASSACGFAALVKALAELYHWNIGEKELSIFARLGSGSACRSLWNGFVEWEKGERDDGLDSHGVFLQETFPALRLGLFIVNETAKPISSRLAMKRTKETSLFFSEWPAQVAQDLANIKTAIRNQDFELLGNTAEANAMAMHALMMTANPPILYMTPATVQGMQTVWRCRAAGIPVYFTQDAGPNLKLLFLEQHTAVIQEYLTGITVINPFSSKQAENSHE